MSRLLTGYAVTFNRRRRRNGHLFQNRYKSILWLKGDFAGRQAAVTGEGEKFSILLGGQKISNGRYRGCKSVGHDATRREQSSAAR